MASRPRHLRAVLARCRSKCRGIAMGASSHRSLRSIRRASPALTRTSFRCTHGAYQRVRSSSTSIYHVEVSPALISSVTDEVIEEVKTWQNRQLDAVYPIMYLDAIQFKVRDGGHVRNKAVYLAIGITVSGLKEVLGLWIAQTEGAKFWLQVVTEL